MRHWDENNLLKLQEQLRENLISSAEFVSAYLLQKPLEYQKKKLFPVWNESSSTLKFINENHWKGYNDRIRRSLLQWHQGHYPLVLWHSIPTPFELLQIQSQGQRVVTVFVQPEEWDQLHHGKDAWDFAVHDLIHADHFFEKPDWRQGQIRFYQFLLKNWNDPVIMSLHDRPDFEYLIADMNSHPRHMLWTLKAIVLKSFKDKLQIPNEKSLDPSSEDQYQQVIQSWEPHLKLAP